MKPILAACIFILAVLPAAYCDDPAGKKPEPKSPYQPIAEDVIKNTPWGREVNGLACRLIVNPKYCLGEPIAAIVEIMNTSKEEIATGFIFNFYSSDWARLNVTGPDGQNIRQRSEGKYGNNPRHFKTIKPDETIQICFSDLSSIFYNYEKPSPISKNCRAVTSFSTPGKYSLVYSYTGQKPAQDLTNDVKLWTDKIESGAASFEIVPPGKDDLKVHEWGVFSIYNDVRYANAGLRAEWESMPDFFYRQFPRDAARIKTSYIGPVDKPVIYFYSDKPVLKLQVSVDFPHGSPVIWWPCCVEPLKLFDEKGEMEPGKTHTKLAWEVLAGRIFSKSLLSYYSHSPMGDGVDMYKALEYQVPKDSWLNQARLEKASPLTTNGIGKNAPQTPFRGLAKRGINDEGIETEDFLYYDGLVPSPDYLKFRSTDKKAVELTNTGKFGIENLFIIDRREWRKNMPIKFAQIEKLEANKELKAEFEEVAAKDWPTAAVKKVREVLIKAGLFEAEADSMLKIWEKGFFERDGLTAFYILPRSEYDRLLPLKVSPEPAETVRVGVALHCHLEGLLAIEKQARELIVKLDDNDYKVREQATKSLCELGPVIAPVLKKTLEESSGEELKTRCRQILDQLDAGGYLNETQKVEK